MQYLKTVLKNLAELDQIQHFRIFTCRNSNMRDSFYSFS